MDDEKTNQRLTQAHKAVRTDGRMGVHMSWYDCTALELRTVKLFRQLLQMLYLKSRADR